MLNAPKKLHKNKFYFLLIVVLFACILTFNLFNLQIAKGSEYYFRSKNSFSAVSIDRAPRGIIYDRNGIKLVDNQLRYNLYIYKDAAKSDDFIKTVTNLNKLFNENIEARYDKEHEKIKNYANYENINEVKLFTKLDYNPYIFQIEANPQNFPLVLTQKTNIRKYLYPELISHIVGYTSEIDEEDYKTGKYNLGDEIGKFGIEKGYDELLRGQNGVERVDFYSSDGKRVTSPIQQRVNGADIYLTIDIEYQKRLYDVIEKALTRGDFKSVVSTSAIVEDVKNGDILALASYPNFDSNKFALGISQEEYNAYLTQKGKPLINKALQYSQPPGSIFKTVTDMAALQNGAITKSTRFTTGGTFEYGGVTFQDAGRTNRGEINVVDGLCVSSNIFHMKAALRLDEVTGGKAADLIKVPFEEMGLNKLSGLNIGFEAPGYFPIPKDKQAKGERWVPGYLLNASIGQGEVKLTPLAAVKLASTIATKGVAKQQNIIYDKNRGEPKQNQLSVAKEHFDTISEGMKCGGQRDNGFLGGIYDQKIYPAVSNKTGTAETGQIVNGQELIHAWEISFTPSDSPEIAMSVFMENGGGGYKGGRISREFYKLWVKDLRNK